MRRRLTVILASDVAGYSRLVAQDEEDTVRRFQQAASAFSDLVQRHQGRVFNTAGDAILAEFASAVDATRCAIDIQSANNTQNAAVPEQRKILFRIGIAVGDVLVAETGDLLGDGVNIAARLEGIAEPGGICISEDVRTHVLNKIALNLDDLGEQTLRNIPRPIRAYKILGSQQGRLEPPAKPAGGRRGRIPIAWTVSGLAAVSIVAAFLIWAPRPSSPNSTLAEAARPFDAATVPLVTDRVRGGLADFGQQPDFKALAISHTGWGVASGAQDLVSAEREALDRCKMRDPKGDCKIYATGNEVVWPPLRLPLPADLHAEPSDVPLMPGDLAGIKGVPTAAGLDAYIKEKDHKALAASEVSFSAIADRPTRAEAIRLVVERCSYFSGVACLLVSVDGFLSVRIPRGYAFVRPYTLAGETEMTAADKARIGKIYGGEDWRALAKGGSNSWYAVNQMESETAAVDHVLEVCHAAERDCALRAIGNFRVGEKR